MTAQEVAKHVMKNASLTQTDVAIACGLAGQSSIGTLLRSKSMRVDSLLLILNACGYELVVRSADGEKPEYVIGENLSEAYRKAHESSELELLIKKAVAEALEAQNVK